MKIIDALAALYHVDIVVQVHDDLDGYVQYHNGRSVFTNDNHQAAATWFCFLQSHVGYICQIKYQERNENP